MYERKKTVIFQWPYKGCFVRPGGAVCWSLDVLQWAPVIDRAGSDGISSIPVNV